MRQLIRTMEKQRAKEVLDRTAVIAKFLCSIHVTNTYLINPILVYGPSMLPTLNLTGDVLLIEGISPRLGKMGMGDVVVVRSPENPIKSLTKRILGMEGDNVTYLLDPRGRSTRCWTVLVRKMANDTGLDFSDQIIYVNFDGGVMMKEIRELTL